MDSKAVNKLLRSEVWPVLRREGFSIFDSRNAWRYRGPLVDVVNFQSFSSHLADGIGCTTFSFGLNLGIFLIGSTFDRHVKRDSDGRARPKEYQCSFRTVLRKTAPIDGFERADIFYVAPDGSTIAPLLREVICLLEEQAAPWFKAFEDLGAIVLAMSGNGPPPKGTETLGLGASGERGSYIAYDLLASLQVERHTQFPESVSSRSCVDTIDHAVGAKLDHFTSGYTTPVEVEMEAYRIRDLLVRIKGALPMSDNTFDAVHTISQLSGPNWSTGPITPSSSLRVATDPASPVTARDLLWPQLRLNGFVEFSDRLAHRQAVDTIEVVSVVPIDPSENRANGYPSGLFRIGLGVFWPTIAESDEVRKNRRGEFRPKPDECQLQMWLIPASRAAFGGPTIFQSAETALKSLQHDAEQWFALCRNSEVLECLLEEPDWRILIRFPTLRGYGSAKSVPRALLRAALCKQTAEGRAAHWKAAHAAVSHHFEHLQSRFRRWVETVQNRLGE